MALRRASSLFSALLTTSAASSSNPSPRQLKEMAVKEFVNGQQTIAENSVVIFSKSYCPFCKSAKDLFVTKFPDVHIKVLELDLRDDGSEIQGYLSNLTNQRTVPNIFINQKHIGGNDKLQALNKADGVKALL